MSEKESQFIKTLSTILGGFILALMLGAFSFYQTTITKIAVQDEKILNNSVKVETMRIEWREDIKEIKMNVDAIRESQVRDKYNNQIRK
jgi:hypothetical protein